MRKKDTLYKANKFNKALFMPNGNIFDIGGVKTTGLGNVYNTNPFSVGQGLSGKALQGLQDANRSIAINNAYNLGAKKGPVGPADSGGINPMVGMAVGALGSINTGDPRGMWDTLDPVYHVAGGRESAAGNAMSDAGVSLTQAGLSSGQPYLALAGAGLKVIGGLTNAAFGISTDKEKLAAVNSGISQNNNFVSNAGSFDDIQGPVASATDANVYKGGWFTGSKARRKNEALKRQMIDARQFAQRSVDNNISNLQEDQLNNALANYAAFGGPIGTDDMGAVNYGFMSDYLTQKKRESDMKNKMTGIPSMPAFMPNSFAIGGDLQTNGADFSSGLTHINAGLSHEENPNDGVQLGVDSENVPNLVEEGETVWNDYVFSNRILADEATKSLFKLPRKKDITFADISKRLEKEIAERPADPISQAGFNAQMQQLEEQQERQKQEMEAERAKAAFEALSPEEQTAVMQRAAQEEQAAQQMAQQQAIAEQQAAMQQLSQEEIPMVQQQQMMQADGSEAALGQEPQMNCFGGKVNRFDEGGRAYTKMLNSLGFHTQKEFDDWAKENNIDLSKVWDTDERTLSNDILSNLWKDENFKKALKAKNPALAHAFSEKGYDWGAYQPIGNGKATIQSISKGNWKTTNGKGWRGSDDLAFKQATEGLSDAEIDALTTEQLAERMRKTAAYQNTNKWLQNSDNALQYLNTLLNDPDTPEVAREYAKKFVKDGKWKDGFNYDYATVFGSNGRGVRETNPGTYWHTALEANRGNQTGNFVINEDGTIEPILGDVPTDWASAGNYAWSDEDNDYAYNYYKRPVVTTPSSKPPVEENISEKTKDTGKPPRHKAEWLRYAGLFGPAVGLGLQAAGIGRPDTSMLDAAITGAGNVALADYQPLGNYLTYRPLDRLFQQNQLNAQARATDRALVNTVSPSKAAGLLANSYNNQIASGNLFRQEQEYNDNLRKQVEEFNRGTDQFNAEAYNRTSQFNADAINRARQTNGQLRLNAAAQKMDADAGWYNGIYGNVAGLLKGIGDIGRENAQFNWLSDLAADGAFGNLGRSNTGKRWIKEKKAKGGKIKKRGLTI